MRGFFNEVFRRHSSLVESTAANGTVAQVNMAYLDIRFSNLCNFRCRMCHPVASSAWHQDAVRLGIWRKDQSALVTATDDPAALWRQLEPLLTGLEEINFAGGEPLIAAEHYDFLERLIEKRLFHVRLKYNTNFSIMRHGDRDAMALWDQFETVEVFASLDAEGARGEYLRTGQDWNQVIENRKRMRKICPRVRFCLTSAVSAMNSLHLPNFQNHWLEEGYVKPADLCLILLQHPEEYRLQILPPRIKEVVRDAYERHLEKVPEPTRADYRAAIAFMMAEDKTALLGKFRERTRALDQMRGESFERTFPELAGLVKD